MSLVAVLAALALSGAPQQAAPTPGQESRVDDIEVVGGRALRDAVEVFADTVVAPPRGRNPARWSRRVCVGAVNLQRETAQALIDRVSQVAIDVGLDAGDPGCRADILILGADDGRAMAEAMVSHRPNAFRPGWSGASRSALQLARFQESDAAVRWWHVALPVVGDTGQIAVSMPGSGPPLIPGGTRLRTEVRNNLSRAIIIVDFNRASSVSFEQLADFVAMAALAQIDPDADMSGFPSVLNVFDDPSAATGLTDWDRAYLTGLYGVEMNRRNPNHTASGIGVIMARDLQEPAEPQGE